MLPIKLLFFLGLNQYEKRSIILQLNKYKFHKYIIKKRNIKKMNLKISLKRLCFQNQIDHLFFKKKPLDQNRLLRD